MMESWRSELGFDRECYRLGAHDVVHTQLLWDALSRSPDSRISEAFDSVPCALGPWSITRDQQGFTWRLSAQPTNKEKLRWRLREWRTERSDPKAVRLALIGESAAASWGYKGEYCLGALLSTSLGRQLERPVEVVDLSYVNAVWDEDSLPAIHAAMTLDPDVVVVFCGNNEARWLLPLLADGDIERVPTGYAARWCYLPAEPSLRIQSLRTAYCERMSTSLARTIALVRSFGKDLVFVVPSSNLRDWSPPELLPHHLEWHALQQWAQAMSEGEGLRAAGEIDASERAFERAVVIDGGMCQQSLHQLGRAQWERGADSAAETLFSAMSAGLGPFVNAVPSLPSFGRQRQLELLRAFKVPYVDMHAALLDEGGPPGRDFFLDYCHLSAAGHEVLVKRLCPVLLRFTQLSQLDSRPGGAVTVDKPSEHEAALAALMAAIHNFQNGQPLDIVEHWLSQAVQHESVQRIVDFFADTICTRHRERITLEVLKHAGIVDAFLNERFLIFGLKFLYHERFDIDLLRLIQDLRGGRDDGPARVRPLARELLGGQTHQLKTLFYLDRRKGFALAARDMSRRGWEQPWQDFVAYDLNGEIEFYVDTPDDVSLLRIVASPPWQGAKQGVQVFLNEHLVGAMHLHVPCSVSHLDLGSAGVTGGVNKLQFRWDTLFCPEQIGNCDDRQRYWLSYGPYPVAAVIHDLAVAPDERRMVT